MAPDWLYKVFGVRPREKQPEPTEKDYKVDVTPHGHCLTCGAPTAKGMKFCSKTCSQTKRGGGMSTIWWVIIAMMAIFFLFAK
ncbi:MAG: DUF2116 family Zn-ribbon domain-containing protein [archaeon]